MREEGSLCIKAAVPTPTEEIEGDGRKPLVVPMPENLKLELKKAFVLQPSRPE